MHEPVNLTESSEFFIALCKNEVHSFLVAGVKNEEHLTILVAVGKQALSSLFAATVINPNPYIAAALRNEPFMLKEAYQLNMDSQKNSIRYKAYSIRYEEYLHLLASLKDISLMQNRLPIMAYCPTAQNPMLLHWQSTHNWVNGHDAPDDSSSLQHSGFERISLDNTCRHSALKLMAQSIEVKPQDLHLSSFFLQKPPLKTQFSGRTVDQSQYPFCILPPPPSLLHNQSEEKSRILKRLYRRLEQLLADTQKKPAVLHQFNELKDLYLQLTSEHLISLPDVVHLLDNWEAGHQELISPANRHCFFHKKSGNEQMFDRIHKDLALVAAHQPPGQ
jgi:hypothetical protein